MSGAPQKTLMGCRARSAGSRLGTTLRRRVDGCEEGSGEEGDPEEGDAGW